MLYLITGTPGASKTSNVIAHVIEEAKGRPVFYSGIPLTQKGASDLGWQELTDEQAALWHEHTPKGAVIIIDEVQRIWRARGNAGVVPPGVVELETHRHRGVDIYLITQNKMLMDHNVRRLVNEHWHIKRPAGLPTVVIYRGLSGEFDPADHFQLQACDVVRKRLPKHVWPLYKSAEVHTHKAKLPWKVWLFPVGVVLMLWLFWTGYRIVTEKADQMSASAPAPVSSPTVQPTPVSYSPPSASPRAEDKPPADWATLLTPEVPGLPYTAPLYRDKVKVNDIPRLAGCIQTATSCDCYTQQATRISGVSPQVCAQIVKGGTFDFQRESPRQEEERPAIDIMRRAFAINQQILESSAAR